MAQVTEGGQVGGAELFGHKFLPSTSTLTGKATGELASLSVESMALLAGTTLSRLLPLLLDYSMLLLQARQP